MTPAPANTIAPRPNVHARRFDNELVILDLERGTYFSLDEVGADMWQGFLEGLSILDVARRLKTKYQVPEQQLLDDACDLAKRLTEAGLTVIREPGST